MLCDLLFTILYLEAREIRRVFVRGTFGI